MYCPNASCAPRNHYKYSFCKCWMKKAKFWKTINLCYCGESVGMRRGRNITEWRWEPPSPRTQKVRLSQNRKQMIFYPFITEGPPIVKGDTPFVLNYHYYWEVKILSETLMSNIMIGLGTNEVMTESYKDWYRRLGCSTDSYGLNHFGEIYHVDYTSQKSTFQGFCRGSIVGVRLDMWAGTLEYYINRQPQGIVYRDLRRHTELYPMIYSTGQKIGVRLVYSSSYKASLFVESAKILGIITTDEEKKQFPLGFQDIIDSMFWLLLPSDVDDTNGEWDNYLKLCQDDPERARYLPISATLNGGIRRRRRLFQ